MLARGRTLQSVVLGWGLLSLGDWPRSLAEWSSSKASPERVRPLLFGSPSTLPIYRLRLSRPLNLSRIFGCSGVILAASAKALAKAITLGYRPAGDRESARIITASSSGEKLKVPSPASFNGIGGMVKS